MEIERAAAVLSGVANAKRLEILNLLAEREISVGTLADLVELSQSALSQHLAKLRHLQLVTYRRDAQTIYYSSRSIEVNTILEAVKKMFAIKAKDRNPQMLKVLIVEDDYYLAENVKKTFENAGARVIGPAAKEAEAVLLMENEMPDIAIIDLNLGNGVQFKVAEQLRLNGVPFCIVTGYDRSELTQVPAHLENVPWMIKPATQEAVLLMAISTSASRF